MIVVGWLACGPNEPPVPTWEADIGPLVEERCAYCHVGEDTGAPYLELDENPFDNLIDQPTVENPTMPYVTPGDRYLSYMYHKVNATQTLSGGSGTSMPFGSPLPESDVELIGAWIDGGAPP